MTTSTFATSPPSSSSSSSPSRPSPQLSASGGELGHGRRRPGSSLQERKEETLLSPRRLIRAYKVQFPQIPRSMDSISMMAPLPIHIGREVSRRLLKKRSPCPRRSQRRLLCLSSSTKMVEMIKTMRMAAHGLRIHMSSTAEKAEHWWGGRRSNTRGAGAEAEEKRRDGVRSVGAIARAVAVVEEPSVDAKSPSSSVRSPPPASPGSSGELRAPVGPANKSRRPEIPAGTLRRSSQRSGQRP